MGTFLNEIDANLRMAIVVFIVGAAPTFGYFFNSLMNKLHGKYEHTSLYVAIGVLVTLAFGALLSWKAALLLLSIFVLTGLPMVIGEFIRTERERERRRVPRKTRRMKLPYAANGLIDDAAMATGEAVRLLSRANRAETLDEVYKHQAAAILELTTITSKLAEVKQIQMEK
jgi:ABC-type multidrug transport system fused ATPase/permease subunit